MDTSSFRPPPKELGTITLDHVGFAVADYQRSKDFYEKALAPLGLKLLSAGSLCVAAFTSR